MRRRQPGLRIIAILALGFGLVVARQQGWLSPVADTLWGISRPVATLLGGSGRATGGWFDRLGGSSLEQENQRLRDENAELRQQVVRLKEAEAQNKVLRQQLNFSADIAGKLQAAAVVAYQPDSFRQFITINRGRKDGLKVGMAVVAEGSLVGKISEVSSSHAKVFLINNPDFKVNGLVQESRASGTVKGQLGSGLVMDKVPQGEDLKPGYSVVTSGLGGEFPKGILIGRVESVDQSENAIFQTAQLATPVRFQRLELVFVLEEE